MSYSDFHKDFEERRREFDKSFKRMSIGIGIAWAVGVILSLGVIGVIIWGIIQLVNWVTTK